MRRAVIALLAGSLLAVGAVASWQLVAPDASATRDAAQQREGASEPAHVPAGQGTPSASAVEPGPGAAPPLIAPPVAQPPVEVRLAGLTVPIDPVGLDEDRMVVIPEDVGRAGWYSPGPLPGAPTGSAVLVGHVDDRTQGLGAFAVLPELAAGDEITVRVGSGRLLTYDVVSLERFPKEQAPLAHLFAVDGPHRLVLITCGGSFDASRSSYRDNVVVTAVPRS